MRVKVDNDEWYPVYGIGEAYGEDAELTEDELERVRAVFAAFDDVQNLLRTAICRVKGHERHESDRKWIDGKGTVRGNFVWCDVCGIDMESPSA